ncbi:D-methionine transport system permease protein MetI [Saezia sanguinis]|uniref:D-methionine transport system permease protein MetI n=1 Tax=Saezia sanguinis TaxID=1965230 RepID=A0A433SAY9_9BURK|nr:methionine ABC transporter permease [Saezia sanguinis]RUS65892.1 D-methionine transport system permease protein MetI [Saezia sanguinis]
MSNNSLTDLALSVWNTLFGGPLVWDALWETLIMVGVSGFAAIVLGIPLGILLNVSDKGGLLEGLAANRVLGFFINVFRSIPFIILCVAMFPLTAMIMGTSIGVKGAILPLTVAAVPFMARLAETSFKEVPSGLIEAAQGMGATPSQIVFKVLLPEAMPGIISGVTIMLVSLIGYSAMAGMVGAGGLGTLAINYGYYRYRTDVMIAVMIVIVVVVQLVQWFGDWLAARVNHR